MKDLNRLLIFDLKGNIAHFRKFYTSSSSLSYSFPPRTTLTGIIGAILGRERDSYYEEFSADNCRIALSIRGPIRKIMQTVNYIWTKDGYSSAQGVINLFITRKQKKYPTPIELVVNSKLTEEIIYRVYFYHKNNTVMNGLYNIIENGNSKYPVFLGLSEFLATINFIADVPLPNIKEMKSEKATDIVTVCNADHIAEFEFVLDDRIALQYVEERMPLEFAVGREIKRTANFIHEKNQKPIKACLNIPCLEISYGDKDQLIKEHITFME
jgi:CRISPR-associated protein Cas5h